MPPRHNGRRNVALSRECRYGIEMCIQTGKICGYARNENGGTAQNGKSSVILPAVPYYTHAKYEGKTVSKSRSLSCMR